MTRKDASQSVSPAHPYLVIMTRRIKWAVTYVATPDPPSGQPLNWPKAGDKRKVQERQRDKEDGKERKGKNLAERVP